MVAASSSRNRLPLPRASEGGSDIGCQSLRLGRSLPGTVGSRNLVNFAISSTDQLVGAESDIPGPHRLPPSRVRFTCPRADGQHHCQGSPEPFGGHKIEVASTADAATRKLGREQSSFHTGGIHLRDCQCSSRLAQPPTHRQRRVEAPPPSLQGTNIPLRDSGSGLVRNCGELSSATLLHPFSSPSGGGHRCPARPVARGPSLCLSAHPSDPQGDPKAAGRTGGDDFAGSALASQSMVCGLAFPIGSPTLAHTSQPGCLVSGRPPPPGHTMAQSNRLEVERLSLNSAQVPPDVIRIIQAARRPSTERIYSSTWRAFCRWCQREGVQALHPSIVNILVFLRQGFSDGLSPNTLRRQVAALSSMLSCGSLPSLAHHSLIRRFLRGASNLAPPMVHRYPTWNLPLVLESLTGPPYEPLRTVSLRLLSCKVAFLVAITSARRISEIAALSIRTDLCVFHADRVVLRLDPTFIPKINSVFHRSQELILPNFSPHPTHPRERRWHTLDVRRALRIYIKRTAAFRRSEAMFVSFLPVSLGHKVSSATIGRWIRQAIASAYELRALPRPPRLLAHSTRSAATSAAWSTQASLLEVCRAATWSSPVPFIRHYKLDSFASAEAAFGRQVLQQVLTAEGSSGQTGPPPVSGH